MGWNDHHRVRLSPCPNCKVRQGFMSSSTWEHDYQCCGERCGVRLGHRIMHGFKPGMRLKNPRQHVFPPQPSDLRIRIKMLEHGVRRPTRWDGYRFSADYDDGWWLTRKER